MKSIFELVSKHVEPSIKRSIVESLVKRGMPRTMISKCLGISTSLITRYLRKERGLHDFTNIADLASKIEELADRIVNNRLCKEYFYYELIKLTIYALSKKYVCEIHYSIDKSINPAKCHICPEIFKNTTSYNLF
ncbi:MAG: XRE family transcriptional regulator [Desulfurococcaceae archaeon]